MQMERGFSPASLQTALQCRLYLPELTASFPQQLFSAAALQVLGLSLPRLSNETGLKSSFPSGEGLEDMGMPYRKFDRTELLEAA